MLEVGAMVLVVPPGGGQPQAASQLSLPIRTLVVAVEGDGGRVIVQLVQIDVELAHPVDDDRQGQGRDVGVEEAVEAAADAIVVERGQLSGTRPEELWDVPRGPLADPVKWHTGD